MSTLPDAPTLVRALQRRARKSYGQHFLSDPGVLTRIAGFASLTEDTRVLEVGPGPGGLTVHLLASGARVHAVEADADMVAHLEEQLGDAPNFSVERADATTDALDEALDRLNADAVVSNLPYNAASPILFRLLDRPSPPERMVLMFQLEVAERVACAGEERRFGPLGLASNLVYRTKLAMTLRPGAFSPPPKVKSAVVVFERRPEPLADAEGRMAARAVARAAFAQRRKMLRKSLASFVEDPIALCTAADVLPTARPEALDLAAFVRLGAAWTARRAG